MCIVSLFMTITIFFQLTTVYYVQDEISNLSNTLRQENAMLYELINKHYKEFTICYGIVFDSNQKIEDIESTVNDINQKIYEMMEDYNKLNTKINKNNSSNKKPYTNGANNNRDDDNIYDDWYDIYYGRLHVPSANISVALYRGDSQSITDRIDSANIFTWSYSNGFTIADHNTQEFAKLFNVEVGTKGYIERKSGNVINIKCVDVFNGNNTGKYIVDTNGVDAADRTDYMMYTCVDNWKNVRIFLWEII